jgi:hypothetical protein
MDEINNYVNINMYIKLEKPKKIPQKFQNPIEKL